MNDLVLICKNLFRRKLRAALMVVSILIAFAIFGVLAGFERAFHASTRNHQSAQATMQISDSIRLSNSVPARITLL